MITIPPGLKEAIEEDDLVLFVGAGLSWGLKNTKNELMEGWDKMVKSVTSHLNNKGYITDEDKRLCDGLEPIDALEIIENKGVDKSKVANFIKRYFALGKGNDFSLHRKMFNLSGRIITTNYDRAFEEAVPELQELKAFKTKDFELNRLKKGSMFLFKLHGCVEHMDSMILFPSDYNNLYSKGRNAEHALYALRNLIFNKVFLFIGTGLGDHQINGIFREIDKIQGIYNQEHYIITGSVLDKSLDFLTPIQIGSYEEVPKIIDQLLEIKKVVEAKKDSQKKILLEQLKESDKEKAFLTEELNREKNENRRQSLLLEREANNHFNIGVTHHLAGEYLDASKEYEIATELKSGIYEAYNNWGLALYHLSKTKSGSESEDLYKEAYAKYDRAIDFNPDYHEAYYNWGLTLYRQAKMKSGEDSEKLYKDAFVKYEQATRSKLDYYEAYYIWGNALRNLAEAKSSGESEDLYKEAIAKYDLAIQSNPDYHEAYNNWGVTLCDLAKTESGSKSEDLYKEAIAKYDLVIRSNPDYHEAYNNWGLALHALAKTKFGGESEKLYDDAFVKYDQAIQTKPDCHEAYNNWGLALCDLAKTKSGGESEKLYDDAFVKYEQATRSKSDYHEAYYNWGNALCDLAETKSGSESEELYEDAFVKYDQAIQTKPDCHEAYNNWGLALCDLAERKFGSESEELYEDAFLKYDQAIQSKPDCHEAYNNWGNALYNLSKTKSGSKSEELYNEAIKKFQQAIENGGHSYNLACIYAIRNKKEEALKYLERSFLRNEISVEFVMKDKDWSGFYKDFDFNILSRMFKKG